MAKRKPSGGKANPDRASGSPGSLPLSDREKRRMLTQSMRVDSMIPARPVRSIQQQFRDAFGQAGIVDALSLGLTDKLVVTPESRKKTSVMQQQETLDHPAKGLHPETFKLLADASAHELTSLKPEALASMDPNEQMQALAKQAAYTRFGKAIGATWANFAAWRQRHPNTLLGTVPHVPTSAMLPITAVEDDILLSAPAESMALGMSEMKVRTKLMMDYWIRIYASSNEGRAMQHEMTGLRKVMGNARSLEMSLSGGMGTAIKFILNTHALTLEHLVRRHGAHGVNPKLWREAIDANGTYISLLASKTNIHTLAALDTFITQTNDADVEAALDRLGLLNLHSGDGKMDRAVNLRFHAPFRPECFRFADDQLHLDIHPSAFTAAVRKQLLSQSPYTYGCPAMDEGVVLQMYKWLSDASERYVLPFTRQYSDEVARRIAGVR